MAIKWDYSFDDESVTKFSYDLVNKRIEIHFIGYFDEIKDKYFDVPCAFIVENWIEAISQIFDYKRSFPLNHNLGIIHSIFYMQFVEERFEMFVETLDKRLVLLIFDKPKLSLIV